MSSHFDKGAFNVKAVEDREGAGIAQENTQAGIGNTATIPCHGMADVDAAAKSAEFGEVGNGATAEDQRAGRTMAMRHEVVKANVMV